MPIFDLFKKSPKKDPARDNPLGSPEMQKKRHDAAMEFLKAFQERIPLLNGKPHAGTVLSAAAWLAGTSLYRSLNYKHTSAPGTFLLSNEANEVVPKLIHIFLYYCHRNGFEFKSDQLVLKTPDEHKSTMEIRQVQEKFQDPYNAIMQKHGLDYLDGAKAGMIVCSILLQYYCSRVKDIDPNVAVGIVSKGVIAGAKTVPPPPSGSGAGNENKTHSRLVLGERDAAIQEALDNGGAFIDVNPEVLRTLKAGNIDPYMVYEQALLLQIEKKVYRIDFVKANVDELSREWKGKPQDQAPMHVRLILWLNNNASTHGYQQSGNSWVLKR